MNSYERLNFVNGQPPKLDADNLNHIDAGIANAFEDIGTLDTNVKTEAAKVTQAQADIATLINNAKSYKKYVSLGAVLSINTIIACKDKDTIYEGEISFTSDTINGTFTMWINNSKRFILCGDGSIWVFATLSTTTCSQLTYTAEQVDELLTDKANTDEVYTVEEADERFLSKPDAEKTYLQKSDGAVETSNIAAKAVTSEKIAAGAVTSTKIGNNAVGTSNIADYSISNAKLMSNSVSTEKIADGAVTLAKLGTDVNAMFDSKYDASNIESGTGVLSPHSTAVQIVKSADFVYQKVGNTVTLNVNLVFNEGTNSTVIFTNLPFVCKNSINPRELCITNCKTIRIWAINKNNTWFNIIAKDSTAFIQDETLAFTLTYLIA